MKRKIIESKDFKRQLRKVLRTRKKCLAPKLKCDRCDFFSHFFGSYFVANDDSDSKAKERKKKDSWCELNGDLLRWQQSIQSHDEHYNWIEHRNRSWRWMTTNSKCGRRRGYAIQHVLIGAGDDDSMCRWKWKWVGKGLMRMRPNEGIE